jgi:hypothetical protein
MSELTVLLLAACILLGAALYTSVGHAGASAYIALMAQFGLAPAVIRPTALATTAVGQVATFRDDALKTHFAGAFENNRPVALDMLREPHPLCPREQLFQFCLAFLSGWLRQCLADCPSVCPYGFAWTITGGNAKYRIGATTIQGARHDSRIGQDNDFSLKLAAMAVWCAALFRGIVGSERLCRSERVGLCE